MKLYYYSAPKGNVGDDLNPWLWPKVLGDDVLSNNDDHLLIGIGTLLNHKIPMARDYTVLTSGVGYGDLPDLKTGNWHFVAIRGSLTKQALNIDKTTCLLDGAYLMPRYFNVAKKSTHTHKVAYIPHVDSATNGLWEKVCEIAGIKYIDPRMGVEQFIDEICSCDKVLTEAMHGAILADA
jgi:succinoglycan biosynthesis protein ExoV